MKKLKFSFDLGVVILTVFILCTGVGFGNALETCESDADCPSDEICDSNTCYRPCGTHCDCLQGDFCYKGHCITDPKMPVYCCAKPGCPPGVWCITPEGTKDRCAEDESYVCDDACDCGPAHACIDIPEVDGKRCVKDIDDPWIEGGVAIFGAEIPEGEPTYCCAATQCMAGRSAYGSAVSEFACYDKYTQAPSNYCGGKSCFYSGDCDRGQACVDVYVEPVWGVPREGTFCSSQGGRCFSNATAEAVFGWHASALLIPCTACVSGYEGMNCELGWEPGGPYIAQRVIGKCGACPNGTCDEWETPLACPEDCPSEFCGDASCGSLETPKNCPEDCGPDPVCGDGSCDQSEVTSCAEDCGCQDSPSLADYPSLCGDGYCDPNLASMESCETCPGDCGAICPVALCRDVTVSAGPSCAATASIDNGSHIADESQITLAQFPTGPYPEGDTEVTLVVTNEHGGTSQCIGMVTVVDNYPAQIDNLSVSPPRLWPPNHKFVDVSVQYEVTDNCVGISDCSLSVASNEPVEGTGDGDASPDWKVINPHQVQLRAERAGIGAGRVYTITVMCVDGSGNSSSQAAMVSVPSDMGTK